ncbi:MAG: HD domain-containing protein, partial [Thioalkalivibrio sp.]|nr:HD domain-containing protein [Thioalkalivibrio sp.]
MAQDAPNGWSDALALATLRHGETLRKGPGRVPYVTHVVDVAETLAYHYPERDDLIVAGLLHDVVEDTNTTLEEVRQRFGDAVADLVRAVSKDDAGMERANGWTVADRTAGMTADERRAWLWRARREFMLAHLRPLADAHDEAAKDVFRLKAADAHANLGAIARDLR